MKLGNYKFILSTFFFLFYFLTSFAEDEILSSPLINLNELKPSFEETDNSIDEEITNESIKNKKKILLKDNSSSAKFIGLDKITAKTTEMNIKLGETKKFGLLQIKAIKCGKINSINEPGEAAYIQVKDLSDNSDEKVFVFNGWTFSSSPSLKPIDHPVYDIWLTGCENV